MCSTSVVSSNVGVVGNCWSMDTLYFLSEIVFVVVFSRTIDRHRILHKAKFMHTYNLYLLYSLCIHDLATQV